MGKPEDLTATIDAQEVDRTGALYRVREVPLPPGRLVPEWAISDDAGDIYEAHEAAIDYVVSRHWNSALEVLGRDGGYSELVLLRSQLQDRLATLNREAEQRSARGRLARYLARVIEYESERLGRTSRVGEVLDRNHPDHDVWRWEATPSLVQMWCGHLPDDEPEQVVLRSPFVDALVAQVGENRLVSFNRSLTWQEAALQAEPSIFDFVDDRDEQGLAELVEFRIEVVDQVLREYEILGVAGAYDSGASRHLGLDAEQEEFLRAAVVAIHRVEAQAAGASGAKAGRSWNNVRKTMELELGRSSNYLERVAEKSFTLFGGPAFEKETLSGSGRKGERRTIERYRRFVRVMGAYARAAGLEDLLIPS